MGLWLVTGADRGIGQALCRLLKARGDSVIAACFESHSSLGDEGIEIATGIDVTDARSIQALREQVGTRRIDVLVNNAGRVIEKRFGKIESADLLSEYAVNAVAPLMLTQVLMPCMEQGSKVVLITSRVGSLGENSSGGLYGYRMSKAAANMAGINLSHELKPRGIAVACLHPGSVRTQMTAGLSDVTTVGHLLEPEDSARGLLARIDELTLETTGRFRHASGEDLIW